MTEAQAVEAVFTAIYGFIIVGGIVGIALAVFTALTPRR